MGADPCMCPRLKLWPLFAIFRNRSGMSDALIKACPVSEIPAIMFCFRNCSIPLFANVQIKH